MAYISKIANTFVGLLTAKGWDCSARRFTIKTTEPALDPIYHVWMAGQAAEIPNSEVMQVRPSRIIVEDHAHKREIERLSGLGSSIGRSVSVVTSTPFIDQLWQGSLAATRARADAETLEVLHEGLVPDADPHRRHVEQKVLLASEQVTDTRFFEAALGTPGSTVAVLADAGCGKTELLRYHEWSSAAFYQSAVSRSTAGVPPIALRVSLRGLRPPQVDTRSVLRLMPQ